MLNGWRLRRRIETKRLELEMQQLEGAEALMASAIQETRANNWADEDKDWREWEPIDQEGVSAYRGLTLERLTVMRNKARTLARDNPHAKGILRNFVKYVVGKGFSYSAETDDPQVAEKAAEEWERFCNANNWASMEREIVKRSLRDGEVFLRFFRQPETLLVRFVDPVLVTPKSADMKHPFGIEYKPDDLGGPPIAYYIRPNYETITSDRIDAKEIDHIKVEVDSDIPRGISVLWSVRRRLRQYDTWLGDRLILNKLRTAIVLVRKHKGASPSQIAAFATAQQTESKTDDLTGDSYRSKTIHPGSVVDIPDTVDLEYMAANINARDVAADGRAVLLSVAAGIGQPEYMVTGDASNANYASTMVAEGPGVKEFEYWQGVFGGEFAAIWRRVMAWAGQAHAGAAAVAACGVQVVGARVITRKPKEEAETGQILADNGVISKRTWAAREGLDYEEEQRYIEAEEGTGAGGPVSRDEGEAEDEGASLEGARQPQELPAA